VTGHAVCDGVPAGLGLASVIRLQVAEGSRLRGVGLGRRLWERLRDHALRSGNPGLFKVNSSINAVPVYERFGFVIAAPRVERFGGDYVPMILRLARSI
jgi:GNAT superfamily N-acetyltransferase